ncbi:uncharacterized protein LOC119601421 [Lucilia sericata]|uniref:uncharacterized protein LOC119601421 n=1 Tax=Lucilia sericata TaxID=13632 RepID=UPI0018A848A3|nr:uncharacterized protein LOC119601421 [Lucilia sericata]
MLMLARGSWQDIQRCLAILTYLCMNAVYENFREHFWSNDDKVNNENLYLRLFFYVNSLILITLSWRKYDGHDIKAFIVKQIKKYNTLRKKAKKKRKRKRTNNVIVM